MHAGRMIVLSISRLVVAALAAMLVVRHQTEAVQ